MRYVLIALSLVAFSATAETPGLQYKVGCDGADIIIIVKSNKPGIYRMDIPASVCGKFL